MKKKIIYDSIGRTQIALPVHRPFSEMKCSYCMYANNNQFLIFHRYIRLRSVILFIWIEFVHKLQTSNLIRRAFMEFVLFFGISVRYITKLNDCVAYYSTHGVLHSQIKHMMNNVYIVWIWTTRESSFLCIIEFIIETCLIFKWNEDPFIFTTRTYDHKLKYSRILLAAEIPLWWS